MCLKLNDHSTPITGRASPAPGCHLRLSPAPLHSPGKGLGPPTQRESQGPERSRQCPKAPQLARARASELLEQAICKSPPDAAGPWGLVGRGKAGASSCGFWAGKVGGHDPKRVCLPHLWGLPPHEGKGLCLSPSLLHPQCLAHGRCSVNPCYMYSNTCQQSTPSVPGIVLCTLLHYLI